MGQAGINRVTLIGRLTRDHELRYTDGGVAICRFSIAVNYTRKQGEQWVDEVNYFDLVFFGRRGEAVSRYLTKGKQVGIDGELRQNRWEQQDGQKRSKVEIVVQNLQFIGGDGPAGDGSGGGGYAGGGSDGGGQSYAPAGARGERAAPSSAQGASGGSGGPAAGAASNAGAGGGANVGGNAPSGGSAPSGGNAGGGNAPGGGAPGAPIDSFEDDIPF